MRKGTKRRTFELAPFHLPPSGSNGELREGYSIAEINLSSPTCWEREKGICWAMQQVISWCLLFVEFASQKTTAFY